MTIGQFAKDDRLRYVKQLIIRSDNPGLLCDRQRAVQ